MKKSPTSPQIELVGDFSYVEFNLIILKTNSAMFSNFNNNYEFNRNISVENIRYNVRRTISIPAKILTIPTFLLFFLILYPAIISAIPPIKNRDSKSRKGPFNSIDCCM